MPGTFILSLDTEIAWGTYSDLDGRAPAFDDYPSLLKRLVQQLDIYEIPATWAVVGHLLLPKGERTTVPQPTYSFASQPDSARMQGRPAEWFYAPYLLDTIQSARVPQEIGTHTFTHVLADVPGVTRELFDEQLAEVVRVHTANGLPPPRSLVYPQNRIAHTDLLLKHGMITYRGPEPSWYRGMPGSARRIGHLLDRTLAVTPPTFTHSDCLHSDGLVNLPASQFLMSYDGVRGRIPTASRVMQAKRGLKQAIERDEIYHLWFHPFNLGSSDAMFEALSQILSEVWRLREGGVLLTRTMGDVAAEFSS
jgi:peptidoglycan/xylan/chitin deacetylase (PgdA/CDA1 family)